MPILTQQTRVALEAGHLAHLVTLNEDGSPQVTIIWVGLDGDGIVSGHLGPRKKLHNVERDPRVTLSMETGGVGSHGLAEYLVINGVARVTEGGAPALLQRLAHVYLGPDVRFPADGRPARRLRAAHYSGPCRRGRPLDDAALSRQDAVGGQPQLAWVGHCFLWSDSSVATVPLTVRLVEPAPLLERA